MGKYTEVQVYKYACKNAFITPHAETMYLSLSACAAENEFFLVESLQRKCCRKKKAYRANKTKSVSYNSQEESFNQSA